MDRKHYRAPWWTQPEAGTAVDTQWTSDRPRGGARGLLGSEGSLPFGVVSTQRPAPREFTLLLTSVKSLEEESHQRSLGTTGSQQKVRQYFSEHRDQSGRWSSLCSSPLSGSRQCVGAGTRTSRHSPQSRGVGGPGMPTPCLRRRPATLPTPPSSNRDPRCATLPPEACTAPTLRRQP